MLYNLGTLILYTFSLSHSMSRLCATRQSEIFVTIFHIPYPYRRSRKVDKRPRSFRFWPCQINIKISNRNFRVARCAVWPFDVQKRHERQNVEEFKGV